MSARIVVKVCHSIWVRWERLRSYARSFYWKTLIEDLGGSVGTNFFVKKGVKLSIVRGARVRIGNGVTLAEDVRIYVDHTAELEIGSGVFIGNGTVIAANQSVRIGGGSQIAHYVTVIDTDHGFGNSKLPLSHQTPRSAPVRIGEDVWIGAQAVVLRGRRLADRSVVGAGTVLTHDLAGGEVAVGAPLRVIRKSQQAAG